jgi:hypothetical protein
MNTIYLILLILAAVCFVAAAFLSVRPATNTARPMPNLIALGLFFWVLVPLIERAKAM